MYDDIIKKVNDNIEGRFVNPDNETHLLLETVEKAGEGNYLEIGVLHGGSLCAVGLLKKTLGHKGVCVGVDPLSGYRYKKKWQLRDSLTGVPVTQKTVLKNIGKLGLDNIKIIKAHSPNFETDLRFSVSYIDGDHAYDSVLADWLKVKDLTDNYVVFHDYSTIRGVTRVVDEMNDSEWLMETILGTTVVFKKNG